MAVHGNLAELCYEVKDYRDAAVVLGRLLQHYPPGTPGRYRVLTWLGDCYVFLRDYDRASRCFETVLNAVDSEETERAEARIAMNSVPRSRKRRRH